MNIIITGATGKIGSNLAKALAKDHNLLLHYNKNNNYAQKLKDELGKYNNIVETISFNFNSSPDIFIDKCNSIFPCEGLIVCHSLYKTNNINSFREKNFIEDININALSPLLLIKAFAKKKNSNFVINFLDSKGLSFDREHFTYSLSQELLAKIIKECAFNYAPIRVNGIALGLNESDVSASPINLPIKEKVTFEDITDTVCFLINSKHITGDIIHLDSGRHVRNYSNHK